MTDSGLIINGSDSIHKKGTDLFFGDEK